MNENENENELVALREHIDDLEAEHEKLEALLSDMTDYLQHKPVCSRLLTKKDCDCGLVELMTRVHEELDEEDIAEPDEENENGDEDEDEDDEEHEKDK